MSSGATDTEEPLLLTYKQASKKIGVSTSQLYRLMRQGKIRKLDLGPQVRRISLAECESYVKQLETEQYGNTAA